ncbi:hypothetical protein MPH_06583 [Macrophomina phaseolina MS6]|uniref:Uncharacterized protein n=1 Tax=Macrophomina phaseolina (strain MS6) TaxID=1126212 RepID=K2R1Q1_MACPH|nr:hypothetical protein MPH_06583 [Macrophomina phaseolina MS6]
MKTPTLWSGGRRPARNDDDMTGVRHPSSPFIQSPTNRMNAAEIYRAASLWPEPSTQNYLLPHYVFVVPSPPLPTSSGERALPGEGVGITIIPDEAILSPSLCSLFLFSFFPLTIPLLSYRTVAKGVRVVMNQVAVELTQSFPSSLPSHRGVEVGEDRAIEARLCLTVTVGMLL